MVSLAAGPTDLCLLTVLTDALALLLVGAAGEQARQEGQQQQDGPGGDGHVQAGGVLDVIGCVAQLGNGKHRGADDVFIMDEAAVLGVVGVALGTEAQSGGSSSSGTTSTTRWVATVFSSSMKVMTCPGRMVVGSTFFT